MRPDIEAIEARAEQANLVRPVMIAARNRPGFVDFTPAHKQDVRELVAYIKELETTITKKDKVLNAAKLLLADCDLASVSFIERFSVSLDNGEFYEVIEGEGKPKQHQPAPDGEG